MSSRQSVGIVENKIIDFNETGSMHMSNEFNNNERFNPKENQRKMTAKVEKPMKDIQLRTQQKSRQPQQLNEPKNNQILQSIPSCQASDSRDTFNYS